MPKTCYYRRPMRSERQFLRLPNSTIVMALEINRNINEKQMRDAVEKVSLRHPLLKSRMIIDELQNAYFTNEDAPSIEVHTEKLLEETKWPETALSQIQTFVNKEQGSLIRFLLLSTGQKTLTLISCDHSICDGMALCFLVEDLMKHLNNPQNPVEPLPLPLPMHQVIPSKAKGNFLFRFLINRINKKWRKKKIKFSNKDYQKLHEIFWKSNKRNLIVWDFPKKLTSELISKSRSQGITVNSLVNTVFLAAQNEVQGSSENYLKKVIVPVNVRPYLNRPVGKSFAYYAGAIRLDLQYDNNKSFWKNAQYVDSEIQKRINGQKFFDGQKITLFAPTFVDSFSFVKYGMLNDDQVTKLVSKMGLDRISVGLSISNLGKLDFPEHKDGFNLFHIYGPVTFSDTIEKYIGVVTCNGSMSFTFSAIEKLGLETMFKLRDSANKHFVEALGAAGAHWDGLLKQKYGD